MKIYVVPEDDSFTAKAKAWCKNRWADAQDFADRHPVITWIVLPTLLVGACDLTKGLIKSYNLSKEESLKNLYCYDRKLGHYWKLSDVLSNDQWLEVQNRMDNGEKLGSILDSMGALKR